MAVRPVMMAWMAWMALMALMALMARTVLMALMDCCEGYWLPATSVSRPAAVQPSGGSTHNRHRSHVSMETRKREHVF